MRKRSTNHLRAQQKGKVRDHYTCQICGSTEKPEGHHIFDFSFGGAPDSDNIITLCNECHKKVHKGAIDLFKF